MPQLPSSHLLGVIALPCVRVRVDQVRVCIYAVETASGYPI